MCNVIAPTIYKKKIITIIPFISKLKNVCVFFLYLSFLTTFTKTTEWVKFHAVKQEIMFSILEIISKNGAEIAFPTQSLQIEHLKGLTD